MIKKLTTLFLAITLVSFSAYSTPPCIASFLTGLESHGDTVCVGVSVDFTNTSDLGGESLTFKQWNFGDGSNPINIENPTHIFTQSGTFNVVFTLASQSCTGLQAQRTITVIDPPNLQSGSQDPSCFGFCDGEAQIFVFGAHTNYMIEWDDPATQNTEVAVNLCDGVYFATVTDIYGCVATGPSVQLTEPDEIIVEAGSDIQICEGDEWPFWEADIVSGGQAPFTYQWEPGEGAGLDFDTILNPILTAGSNSFNVYFLTVTDADGCSGSDDLQVTQSPGAISGTVRNQLGGSGLPGILVSLIKRNDLPDTEWETYATTTTDGNGNYQFLNLPLVDYIVKAEPTQTVPAPDYMPTYYHVTDTVFDWVDAQITSVECGTMYANTDIDMIEILHLSSTCTFEGYVYLVTIGKTQTEDPIPLIDVIVKKTPPGNAIAWTQTGDGSQAPTLNLGQFRFENMPASLDSTYSFVVNIPGLGMQSNYSIEVAFDDSLYGNLNFYVDTTQGSGGIYTYNPLGLEALKYKPHEMVAFPNPFTDNCELRFTNIENTGFAFTLFDVTGKQILRDEKEQGNTYTINTQTLDQGIYIAEVKTGDEVYRTRVMKK
ncbi:MAG: T9SS type A sorting domain-containing protein [Bacteroidia bacterium]